MTEPVGATRRWDILGLGCAAVDHLLYVPSYPPADSKVQVVRHQLRYGGLTGTALVTAARLGAACAYAGCLGTDDHSDQIARNFLREGVDLTPAPRLPEARVVCSTIVVGMDTGGRNIFFENEGWIGAHPTLPSEEAIREAKVLLIDHLGMPGNRRAARIARSAGVAVVADFEDATSPLFPEVLALVDHLILSETFARRITQTADAAHAAQALWQPDRAAVVVTSGSQGCWSVTGKPEPQACHHPAFVVRAADTTGCGDVFHGAYAAGLARGDLIEECIRFATAAAALKAKAGEIPRRRAVEEFLSTQSPAVS